MSSQPLNLPMPCFIPHCLQALKQLGPSTTAPSSASHAAMPPAAATGAVTSEQLSNLAAIMALEGVHSDVVLQTLGLPTTAEAAAAAAASGAAPASSAPMPGLTASALASLDSATLNSQLLHALASPSLSSQTAFDMRGSFDLSTAMRSTGNSMDLSSLQHSLAAAAAGLPMDAGSVAGRMHTADSRSTLASADWSRGPSARTSMDTSVLLPATTAGFLAPAAPLGPAGGLGGMQARLSLDAALQLQHAQQQQAAHQAMLASHSRMSSSAYPLPPMAPQANMASVMHSGFYQPQAAPPPQPQPPQPEMQHSLQTVLSSGLYGGGGAPAVPAPTRHSMHEFGGSGLLPFNDATWAPQLSQQQQHHQHQLGGYSTVLRPSIDRAGLPPLPPRSPNQGAPHCMSNPFRRACCLPGWWRCEVACKPTSVSLSCVLPPLLMQTPWAARPTAAHPTP